jgi:hypothetical protein
MDPPADYVDPDKPFPPVVPEHAFAHNVLRIEYEFSHHGRRSRCKLVVDRKVDPFLDTIQAKPIRQV